MKKLKDPVPPPPATAVGDYLWDLLARSRDGRLPSPAYHARGGRCSPAGLLIPAAVFQKDRKAMVRATTIRLVQQPAGLALDDVAALERFNDRAFYNDQGWSHASFLAFARRLKSFQTDECRVILAEFKD